MRRSIRILTLAVIILLAGHLQAQVDARMLRYPDVSETHIAFVYAGDIWVVPKEGGLAQRLSSPVGQETFPRFSPDGKSIAFSGNYDGNTDVYLIPAMGGMVTRLTHHGMGDRVVGWHPDGKRILYASSMKSGRQRYNQFYYEPVSGGLPERLPVPYAEFGAISPDGNTLAFEPISRSFRTWKRYRGGMAPDIWFFDLRKQTSQNITDNPANDSHPMWHGRTMYFLSDRGPDERHNIWAYNMDSGAFRQVTHFREFDIHFPAIGPSDLVFEAGGQLYLMDLATEQTRQVSVEVVTDEATIKPRIENVKDYIQNAWIAPNGKRVLVEARGDIFSVPAEHGYIRDLTRSSGVAERTPAWSPDGKQVAYWSDRSGEYQLTLRQLDQQGEEKALTSFKSGFRYQPYWSPDSKMLAYIDKSMAIQIYDIAENTTTTVDHGLWMYQGDLDNFSVSWSRDSRWLAYSRGGNNRNGMLFLYDVSLGTRHQITSGYYDDRDPEFDPDGKYLYFLTNRTFEPVYSDFDNSFSYPNATNVAALALRPDVPSPLAPRNDEVGGEEETAGNGENNETNGGKQAEPSSPEPVNIDLEDTETRITVLPPEPGNYRNVQAVSGKVLYHRLPRSGSEDNQRPVVYFDLKEREEKTILEDADWYMLSADGKKLLARKNGSFYVTDVAEGQKLEKPLPTDQLEMTVDPRAEWHQLFTDAWRLERDLFYDPNMHGVDWDAMRKQYGALIDNCFTRTDVNYVIGELIAELSSSHTYRGGGDLEEPEHLGVGYLGVDWEVNRGVYRIQKIIRGAPWDAEVRSPLDEPGVAVREGDYILAVNGAPLDVSKDPWAGFQGLAGKTVELTVNNSPSMKGARTVIVETMPSETRLRHLAWIEANRQHVADATGNRVGYIYVRSTGVDAQNELVRQFAAQFNKDGLIIDERFNSGGQIPDRFVELLDRPPLAFWAVRDGKDWQWPPVANFGPKVMLINGWSGSGGDAFPDFFRKRGLGPLIGSRTWGGLIGITGAPQLIDGGSITVPTFRMYDPDGTWFAEGHGVDPDIPVPEDPGQLSRGTDVQLERAIREVMQRIQAQPPAQPERPAYQER